MARGALPKHDVAPAAHQDSMRQSYQALSPCSIATYSSELCVGTVGVPGGTVRLAAGFCADRLL